MVTLADLRARNVLPSWQEAVAIVQELIDTTIAERTSIARVPDIEHIGLDADGRVLLLPGSAIPEDPIQHLAVLLELLLDGASAPRPLLDVIERNRVHPPQFTTAGEFSKALGFFERPGRSDDIARLVARTEQSEEQTRAEDELQRLVKRTRLAAEPPAPETPAAQAPAPRSRWPLAVAGVIVLATVAAAVVGLTFLGTGTAAEQVGAAPGRGDGGTTAGTDKPHGTSGSPQTVRASLVARVTQAVRSTVQSLMPREEPRPAPVEPAVDAARTAPPRRGTRTQRESRGGTASDETVSIKVIELGGFPLGEDVTHSEFPGPSVPTAAPGDSADTIDIYSAADLDVLQPVILRPVIPAAEGDEPLDRIAVFEIVVGSTGQVEQVQTVSVPSRYHDRMILAHLKAWTFQPATRNGIPVRYRLRVRLLV